MCIPQKGNSGVSLNDTNFRLLDLRKGGGTKVQGSYKKFSFVFKAWILNNVKITTTSLILA